jgi:hypothetical protein
VSDRTDPLGPRYQPGAPRVHVPSRGERLRARARQLLWPPRPATWAALLAAVVGGLGLYGLAFLATLPARLPSEIDWQAAAALLARDARPGDAVALSPPWAGRAREALPERLPDRPDAALPLLALPGYAGEDLAGVRRVWLVSLPRSPGHDDGIARDLAARGDPGRPPQRLGALEVARYDLRAPLVPLAFLPDRLAAASAWVGDAPCPRDARGGLRCGREPWQVVARQVREVDGRPRVCVLAHPPPGGAPLALEFPDVPIGRALRGHAAIVGDGARSGGAPPRMAVRVGGEEVGSVEAPPGPPGWHPFQLDTSRLAGRARDVSFEVHAADPSPRGFCLEAMTVR